MCTTKPYCGAGYDVQGLIPRLHELALAARGGHDTGITQSRNQTFAEPCNLNWMFPLLSSLLESIEDKQLSPSLTPRLSTEHTAFSACGRTAT